MNQPTRFNSARRAAALALSLTVASPAAAAPPEGCTKGPAEALRSGDAAAAEDALRRALADSACVPVAPDLRLRLAQVLAENHGGKPGPACEAMGLFRRIAAETDDALLQSDAAARADRLTPICAGEATPPPTAVDAASLGAAASTPAPVEGAAPGAAVTEPVEPTREPGTREWGLVAGCGGMLAIGGVLVALSQSKLTERDAAHIDYLAAPFGSAEEKAAADRFDDAQTSAQILVGTGIAAAGIGAVLGIIAVGVWPEPADDAAAGARVTVGPDGLGVVGRW